MGSWGKTYSVLILFGLGCYIFAYVVERMLKKRSPDIQLLVTENQVNNFLFIVFIPIIPGLMILITTIMRLAADPPRK